MVEWHHALKLFSGPVWGFLEARPRRSVLQNDDSKRGWNPSRIEAKSPGTGCIGPLCFTGAAGKVGSCTWQQDSLVWWGKVGRWRAVAADRRRERQHQRFCASATEGG